MSIEDYVCKRHISENFLLISLAPSNKLPFKNRDHQSVFMETTNNKDSRTMLPTVGEKTLKNSSTLLKAQICFPTSKDHIKRKNERKGPLNIIQSGPKASIKQRRNGLLRVIKLLTSVVKTVISKSNLRRTLCSMHWQTFLQKHHYFHSLRFITFTVSKSLIFKFLKFIIFIV